MRCHKCFLVPLEEDKLLKSDCQQNHLFCSECLSKLPDIFLCPAISCTKNIDQSKLQKIEPENVSQLLSCSNHTKLNLGHKVCLSDDCASMNRVICRNTKCHKRCSGRKVSIEVFLRTDPRGPERLIPMVRELKKQIAGKGCIMPNYVYIESFILRERASLLALPVKDSLSRKILFKAGEMTTLALTELKEVLDKALEYCFKEVVQHLFEKWWFKDQSRPILRVLLRSPLMGELISSIESLELENIKAAWNSPGEELRGDTPSQNPVPENGQMFWKQMNVFFNPFDPSKRDQKNFADGLKGKLPKPLIEHEKSAKARLGEQLDAKNFENESHLFCQENVTDYNSKSEESSKHLKKVKQRMLTTMPHQNLSLRGPPNGIAPENLKLYNDVEIGNLRTESRILDRTFLIKLLNLFPKIKILKLLFSNYGEDKDYTIDFHNKCDKAKETIVLAKFRNFVAGGYTDQSWKGNIRKESSKSFLFSLNREKIYKNRRNSRPNYYECAWGPTFGCETFGCEIISL